jgi:uncharacterized repeat protein (TIGR03803 family)
MTGSEQHQGWISRMSLRVVRSTLVLAIGLGLVIVETHSAHAQTFSVLYNFAGSPDGAWPEAAVIRDADGNLYGDTARGGSLGWGTVFKLDTSRTERVLYNFADTGGHGWGPSAGLLLDELGNLYGATYNGGSHGYGTMFEITYGVEVALHNFTGSGGEYPYLTSVLMDKSGNLYGITYMGGASGYGTVYELSKSGRFEVLHSFAGGTTDGCYPEGTLLMDADGNLYGTATECGSSGNGIVWRVSKNGTETVLHNFAGGSSDGAIPAAGVIMDAKGNLYGTTYEGGTQGDGTVYELSEKGILTVLYSFTGSDGIGPIGGLTRGSNGTLYGTTAGGGTSGNGAVYELSTKNVLTVLHSFTGSDGNLPFGVVILDANGILYGTAVYGGSGPCSNGNYSGCGTVWKLVP